MQKLTSSATLGLVIYMSITTSVNAVTEPDLNDKAAATAGAHGMLVPQEKTKLVAPAPQLNIAVQPDGGAASPEPAGVSVAQSTAQSTLEGLQQKLGQNPFLKRFGVKLTALDLVDGFATIEITEGPQAIIDQVAAGIEIADIELADLPSGKDRQTVVAIRKVLDSVMKREQLAAILMVPPPAPAGQGVAMTEMQPVAAAPAAGEEPPEQTVSTSTSGPVDAPADTSAPTMDEKTLVMNVQQRLNELGYDAGPADGIPGRGTRTAIREYQTASTMVANGEASMELLKHMNSSAAVPRPAELARSAPAPRPSGKPVVGVAEFRNTATGVYWWRGGVGWDLSDMLSNELSNTGSFRIVERAKLEPVLREQNLAQSGRIARGTGARIGNLTGAQYLVMGSVSAFERNVAGTGGGISFSGISIGGKKKSAYIAIDLRVVNTTTGEIEFVRTVEARSKGTGISLGVFRGGFGGSLASEKRTPAGKAIRAVMAEITDYLSCAMVERGGCMAEYNAKEKKRRKKLKGSISLD